MKIKLEKHELSIFGNENSRRFQPIYVTPHGINVVKTSCGYCPVSKDGRPIRKRRYVGHIDNKEVWEYAGKKRTSIKLCENLNNTE